MAILLDKTVRTRGRLIMEGSYKRQVRIGALLLFCMLAMLLPAAGQAAGLPAVEQLTGITMSKFALWSPGRLTVGADGTLYVVDSYKNHIVKFDSSGSYIGDIPFPRPSAIAISRNGTLYVGSNQDYSVAIMKNGQIIGHLGAEKNEFRSVRDVAYDIATNNIFVVDNVGNAIRVFDASGKDLGSIAGVNIPIAVEITDDTIYVIDAPIVRELNFKTTSSRISIFDKQFNLLGAIEDYGKNQMFSPTDIAAHNGLLYISDAAFGNVLIFDEAGTLQGEIQVASGEKRATVSIAVSTDGILYISDSETHSIRMYAVTPLTAAQQGGQQ